MGLAAPKNPITDPRTGTVTVEWLQWLQELADRALGVGGSRPPTSIIGSGLKGAGTPETIAKWVASDTLADSLITESGTTVLITGDVIAKSFSGEGVGLVGPPGPSGPAGPPGASSSVFFYRVDLTSTGASDPGSGKLRYNHATQNLATTLYIDWLTEDNFDAQTARLALRPVHYSGRRPRGRPPDLGTDRPRD
jgi:hypothetical protein